MSTIITKYKLNNLKQTNFTYDCGEQPIANPTNPRKTNNHV